ncbi:DUF418 domain-containing protein [Dyella nitratireducens]|uniref:DUF418 domain-containing protein n=1 Tax=Dyella nitratireducens TaxID=1849580 RepID=A0ABQ1GBY6_9GAMM|nr:DUF418 domain-containing protein [Dyella nitratireducens]GGA40730.1 hypothetical protein GCM10010981_32430 [Dyella nitratireducens]GLQ40601.1 hypothetical protein GCM10007902_04500 [Dyella nitratireducens]
MPLQVSQIAAPQEPFDRISAIDILRGIALFGVLMVNLVTEFRVDVFQQFLPTTSPASEMDHYVETGVGVFLELKAFALFSFLFGVGLAIQFERLAKTQRRLVLLVRRLVVLLGFGLIHFYLIWNGDILTEYALIGLIALPMLYLSNVWLATIALLLLAFYMGLPHSLSPDFFWPSTEWLQQHVEEANRVYASGSYAEILKFSWQEIPHIVPLHLAIASRTLALFLLGAVAWRTGLLRQPKRHQALLVGLMVFGLLVGSALNLLEAVGPHSTWIGVARTLDGLAPLSPVILAMGYMSAVIVLVSFTPARGVLSVFGPLGRMAFTNYLMQSLIFCGIFYGYGLGYFGKLGATSTLILGVAVYAIQIVISIRWLERYRFGPVEWLWRTLMYGTRQPFAQFRTI